MAKTQSLPREQLLEALNRTEASVEDLDRRRQKFIDQMLSKQDYDRCHHPMNPISDRQQEVFAINLAKFCVQWQTYPAMLSRVLGFYSVTVDNWLSLQWRVTTRSLEKINQRLKLKDCHELIDRELSFEEIEKLFPKAMKNCKKGVRHG